MRKIECGTLKLYLSRKSELYKVIDSVAEYIANNLDSSSALEVLDQWALDTENGAIGGSVGELSRFIDAALGLAL